VLRKARIDIELPSDKNRGATAARRREVKIWRRDEDGGEPTVQTVQPSKVGPGGVASADSDWTVGSTEQQPRDDSATVQSTASIDPASSDGVRASVRCRDAELGDCSETAWTGPSCDSSRESSQPATPSVEAPESPASPTQPRRPSPGVDDEEPVDAMFEPVLAPATAKKKSRSRRKKPVEGGAP
jgi:hypothetical protein